MSVEPLRGWAHLWAAADIIRPALVVIDPALDAYTGDPNNLAAVREFVSALGAEAAARSRAQREGSPDPTQKLTPCPRSPRVRERGPAPVGLPAPVQTPQQEE